MTDNINNTHFEEASDSGTLRDSMPSQSVSRYLAREQAFILCFERLFSDCDLEETIENAQNSREFQISQYAIKIAGGVEEKRDELDSIISPFLSDKWSISRISKVSLCLLRIAVFEILYVDSVPVSVAINEAVELAKKYSTSQDAGFINGVLGNYTKTLDGEL